MASGSPPIPGVIAVTSAGSSAFGRSGRLYVSIENASHPITRFLSVTLLSFVGLQALGLDFGGDAATQVLCVALLLLGLPHGTFDWQLLCDGLNRSIYAFGFRLGLYLALAAATYLAWQVAPTAALAIFLLIAAIHFSEDWGSYDASGSAAAIRPEFLTLAMPISIITLPALSHPEMLSSIFILLSGDPSAVILTDAMILLAPVATGIATARIFMDCTNGEEGRGVAGICVLSAMVVLPPIAGFSLYFCLYHSPIHFRTGWRQLTLGQTENPALITVGLTTGGLALAALVYTFGQRAAVTDNLIAAVFITLSMLTVPHMIMPQIAGRFQRRGW